MKAINPKLFTEAFEKYLRLIYARKCFAALSILFSLSLITGCKQIKISNETHKDTKFINPPEQVSDSSKI